MTSWIGELDENDEVTVEIVATNEDTELAGSYLEIQILRIL